jgi:hypothetical protein
MRACVSVHGRFRWRAHLCRRAAQSSGTLIASAFGNILDKTGKFLRSSAHMKTTTLALKHSINRTPYRLALVIPLVLACFALLPQARADCQQGCDTSNSNTFLGEDALLNNTTGSFNTAIGFNALFSNTVANYNTAIGFKALFSTTASVNTAIGFNALLSNTTGNFNTATGVDALLSNTRGIFNTAEGDEALYYNTAGNYNTASGGLALLHNATGDENTAVGYGALYYNAGSRNIALGSAAGEDLTTGNNNIAIGNVGVAGDSGTIRIGTVGVHTTVYFAGIRDTPLTQGSTVAVGITPDGQLGVRASSARYKEAIKPMDKASEAILSLKPVTFRYKHELDPEGIPQFGLVAEDVEKVNTALVACDAEGKAYTVRYEAVNAMLLNEFLKEHRKIAQLEKQVQVLTAGLQKVSAQLEIMKPTPQTVSNNY